MLNYKERYAKYLDLFNNQLNLNESPFKFNIATSCNQTWDARIVSEPEIFLTRIIITNDDARRFSDIIPECKNVRLKKPIIVDIYI